MRRSLLFPLLLFLFLCVEMGWAQDSVKYRVILIGDAGEMNTIQKGAMQLAASTVLPGRTSAFFLGDNIYPTGMALAGSSAFPHTAAILKSQFEPLRAAGSAVYFIPGNHDWDKSGPLGLQKIKAQGDYLASFQDSLLQLIPRNGCPDPVAVELGDQLVVIAFDSEWWLFPYDKLNPEADCECQTKSEVLSAMEDLLRKHTGKMILLAAHHPFQSYGSHGGYFTWQNHLFPLAALNKKWLIPLPVIGSLYPFLRSTFLSPEDLKHPLYKDMVKQVNRIFGDQPQVVYVAGHEHGLQLIKSDQLQVVSGSGAKRNPNKKGTYSLFNDMNQGFVIADQLLTNDVRFRYYLYTDTGLRVAFEYLHPFPEMTSVPLKEKKTPLMTDSISMRIRPSYDSVGRFHRWFFGENYRKDYAMETTVPVIRLSEIHGGLTPVRLGGGNQSRSLRLKDTSGKEWVLRSVQKYPEVLLPQGLRNTFAKDILDDNMSAQHPFSALVVPTLAKAADLPHATPMIGWVSPDSVLGAYAPMFEHTLCLLEEREPAGKSDNTAKMFRKLDEDNDYRYDGEMWLRARALDILIGDWDRHEDQWRWKPVKEGKTVRYIPVPRDRDQVFYSSDGFIQRYVQSSSLLPMMQGFERPLKDIDWFLWEGRAMNSKFWSGFSAEQMEALVVDFCERMTDEVLEDALKALPAPVYEKHQVAFLRQLKERRALLPEWMKQHYRFFNRIVDVQASQKHEKIEITEAQQGKIRIKIQKINKEGELKAGLFDRTFDPQVTKEIRLYLRGGNDSLQMNLSKSPIKIRLIAGSGHKVYTISSLSRPVTLHGLEGNNEFSGEGISRLVKKLSTDTSNASYLGKDLYSRTSVMPNVGYNLDDGILAGIQLQFTNPGFRKQPYGNTQYFSLLHSFASGAFQFNYRGEWLNAWNKADLLLHARVKAPDNTQNFFGVGNETSLEERDDAWHYYRTRFNLVEVEGVLRWRRPKSTFSAGPLLQFYRYDAKDNQGRFITHTDRLLSPDSAVVDQNKWYTGVQVQFINNTRDHDLLPTLGSYIQLKWTALKGLNTYARSSGRFEGAVALYKNLNANASMVLANRFGGGFSVGNPAFYQHLFLGGQGNLLGYRQYRFAGKHYFYNNLEWRLKLGDFVSYILPGQAGLIGFHDVGRVWAANEKSQKWHHGVGGGVYFAPASMTVFRAVAGYSREGWFPYFSMNFRY